MLLCYLLMIWLIGLSIWVRMIDDVMIEFGEIFWLSVRVVLLFRIRICSV